jgi:hypothetical protein
MGVCEMELSKVGNGRVSFVQEMFQNKFLLLMVLLAVSAVAYLGIGLVVLMRH